MNTSTPHALFQRALILHQQGRHADAERELRQALGMNPNDWAAHAMLALCLAERKEFAQANYEADAAVGLVKLGRRGEAGAAIDAALARDPQNATTHANQGWTLLHQGDPRKALEHFREALRIDPDLEWARAGIVEALKARYVAYRWILMYFLW